MFGAWIFGLTHYHFFILQPLIGCRTMYLPGKVSVAVIIGNDLVQRPPKKTMRRLGETSTHPTPHMYEDVHIGMEVISYEETDVTLWMYCFFIWQEVQRDKAEQIEKARLRHKHALAQLQLEEVRSSEHLVVISQYSRTLLFYYYWGKEYCALHQELHYIEVC